MLNLLTMFRRGKLAFLNTKDDRIKIINERINLTEKHLVEMCSTFASCTRKLAKYYNASFIEFNIYLVTLL